MNAIVALDIFKEAGMTDDGFPQVFGHLCNLQIEDAIKYVERHAAGFSDDHPYSKLLVLLVRERLKGR